MIRAQKLYIVPAETGAEKLTSRTYRSLAVTTERFLNLPAAQVLHCDRFYGDLKAPVILPVIP